MRRQVGRAAEENKAPAHTHTHTCTHTHVQSWERFQGVLLNSLQPKCFALLPTGLSATITTDEKGCSTSERSLSSLAPPARENKQADCLRLLRGERDTERERGRERERQRERGRERERQREREEERERHVDTQHLRLSQVATGLILSSAIKGQSGKTGVSLVQNQV